RPPCSTTSSATSSAATPTCRCSTRCARRRVTSSATRNGASSARARSGMVAAWRRGRSCSADRAELGHNTSPRTMAEGEASMGRLDGKVALITGAQQGIGRGMANAFARDGADVGINYLDDRAAAESVAAEVRKAGTRATLVAGDGGGVAMTRAMALELAPHGIRVNAVAPGLTDTAQPRYGHSEEELAILARAVPLGRMAEPDDIATVAVFLASDEALYVTGQTVHVNGGSYMP